MKERGQKFSLSERRKMVRKFRHEAGLGLARLAAMAGLSESMLSMFERGKRDLSPIAMERLMEAITDILAGKKLEALRKTETAQKLVPLKSLLSPTLESVREGAAARKQIAESPTLFHDIANMGAQIALLKRIVGSYKRESTINDEIIELLRSEDARKDEKIARLEEQKKLLADLLNVETDKGLATKDAEELREKIAASGQES